MPLGCGNLHPANRRAAGDGLTSAGARDVKREKDKD
jgi:hypothetical protein